MDNHFNNISSSVTLWHKNSEITSSPNGDRSINLKRYLGQFYSLSTEGVSKWADAIKCPPEHVMVLRNEDSNEFAVFDSTDLMSSEHNQNGLVDLATFDDTHKASYFPSFDRSQFKRKVTHIMLLHPLRNLREILNIVKRATDIQIPTGRNNRTRLGKRYALLSGDYIGRNKTNSGFMRRLRELLTDREIDMMKQNNGIPGMYADSDLYGLNKTNDTDFNVCWNSNYLTKNWNACADQFKDSYCNGAPDEDLKTTVPNTDYPNARWLEKSKCKKHARRKHLRSMCDWAVTNNFNKQIGTHGIEDFCGCERELVIGKNANYWTSMGNNSNRAIEFEELINVNNTLMTSEKGEAITDQSDITSVPTACWPSCSKFKSTWSQEYRAAKQDLIDGQAQGDCPFQNCINSIELNGITSITGGVSQGCKGSGGNIAASDGDNTPVFSLILLLVICSCLIIFMMFGVLLFSLS